MMLGGWGIVVGLLAVAWGLQMFLAYRQAHGGFRSVDELRQVEGIGDKRFESLRQAVSP